MRLKRGFSGFPVVFSHENITMNAEAEFLGEFKLTKRGLSLGVLDQ